MNALQSRTAVSGRSGVGYFRGQFGASAAAGAQPRRWSGLTMSRAEEILDWLEAQGVCGQLSFSPDEGFAVVYQTKG